MMRGGGIIEMMVYSNDDRGDKILNPKQLHGAMATVKQSFAMVQDVERAVKEGRSQPPCAGKSDFTRLFRRLYAQGRQGAKNPSLVLSYGRQTKIKNKSKLYSTDELQPTSAWYNDTII